MNDILTEDTDKPTNPWLDLILESNKNKKEPTKLWNLVQDTIQNYRDRNWMRFQERHNPDFETASIFFRLLAKAVSEEQINFNQLNLQDINFSNARFAQQVTFCGASFDGHITFQGARFDNHVDFAETIFLTVVNFTQVEFRSSSNFSKAKFVKDANFRGLKARGKVSFHDATFSGGICMEELNCSDRVEFKGSFFANQQGVNLPLSFSGQLKRGADFSNCVFAAFVQFAGVSFLGAPSVLQTTFVNTTFQEEVIFRHIKFGAADFRRSAFLGECTFYDVFAESFVDFAHSEFHSGASFLGQVYIDEMSEINGHWIMDFAIFYLSTSFRNMVFRNGCSFKSVKISFVEFVNCKFYESADFTKLDCEGLKTAGTCEFRGEANFRDANFHRFFKLPSFDDTLNLRGTNFVNQPPKLFGSDLKPDSDLACTLPVKPNPEHINIYEDLRQHAERLGKLEEKKRFVHAELSCRAIDPQKSPAERFVWWLYYITSDYGTSIYRPLGWLFVLFLMSAVPWVGYAIWFSPMSVWSALSYNILQAVPFTGHLSTGLLGSDAFGNLPMSLHFIAGPVALLNPIFWFLIGLGMRYKLRLAR